MTVITPSTQPRDERMITIEAPVELLRRAQCARSDYSDYGSGDAEHDALGEFVALAAAAVGDHGVGDWTLSAPIDDPQAITASSLWAIASRVSSNLGDTLEYQAQRGDGRCLLVGRVRDQELGVAARAAEELSAALTAHLRCNPVAVTVRCDEPADVAAAA